MCARLIELGLFLLLCIRCSSTQTLDPDAVISVFNVTFTSGGVTNVASTLRFAYATVETALTNLNSANFIVPVVDPCQSPFLSSCSLNADCFTLNAANGLIQCKCKVGFSQTASFRSYPESSIIPDGTYCPDVNECVPGSYYPCDSNATCLNTPGSYSCVCNDGFTGNGSFCEDIDECATDTDNCDNNAECTNTAGSFTCACRNGFNGNGVTCTDIDECAGTNDCDANATCTNIAGSFMCNCNNGFIGNGTFCEASTINFCYRLSLTFDEPTSGDVSSRANDADQAVEDFLTELTSGNVGFSYANYTSTLEAVLGNNTITEFIIELCLIESSQNQDQFTATLRDVNFTSTVGTDVISVLDVNECVSGSYYPCDSNATCLNTPGSYSCVCNDGFTGNGSFCERVICPGNQVFSTCAGCVRRCEDRNQTQFCTLQCRVQCTCPSETFLLGEDCVREEDCPSDIETRSFCYVFLANANSSSIWSNSSISQAIISQISNLLRRYNFSDPSLQTITSIDDGLLEAAYTRYVVRVCLNQTTITEQEFFRFVQAQAEFTIGNFLFTLSDFDECAYNYDDCSDVSDCQDTLGGFRCVRSETKLRFRKIAAEALICYYSPILGLPAFLRCLQNKISFFHQKIENARDNQPSSF